MNVKLQEYFQAALLNHEINSMEDKEKQNILKQAEFGDNRMRGYCNGSVYRHKNE